MISAGMATARPASGPATATSNSARRCAIGDQNNNRERHLRFLVASLSRCRNVPVAGSEPTQPLSTSCVRTSPDVCSRTRAVCQIRQTSWSVAHMRPAASVARWRPRQSPALERVIASKRAARRPKDAARMPMLEAALVAQRARQKEE
jgi:hypothetical protein